MSGPQRGQTAQLGHEVGADDTALALGSGDVPVLGTPRLLALMEAATVAAISGSLADTETSVGTRVELDHLAASPVGAQVSVRAEVVGVDGHQVRFVVVAVDADERAVARGVMTRAVVDRARFLRGRAGS